jgi:two-component system sensor histidine kinase PilS (NtrC family)
MCCYNVVGFICPGGARFLAILNSGSGQHTDQPVGDTDLNRRVLTLVGGFRLLVAAALLLTWAIQPDPPILGERYPLLFLAVTCIYSLAALVIALLLRGNTLPVTRLAWTQFIVDLSCIGLAVHASDPGSGLEAILVLFVVSSAITLPMRSGYLLAALAALAILLEQSFSFLQGTASAAEFMPAGVLGAIMLAMVKAMQPLVRGVRETEELARQRGIDLENLGQLNEYIIQNLREAILVVDADDRIRLINQAAAEQMGIAASSSGERLNGIAPPVHELLQKWRSGGVELSRDIPSFISTDGDSIINAHFAPLGEDGGAGAVLIFLEDASLLAEKVQQTKLAALGRLSASIAHEIRNPVGALSHAAQLLRESTGMDEQDQRFIDIIQTNSGRVSEIVDNILQLSRRDDTVPQRLELQEWTRKFVQEFLATLELYEGQLSIVASEDVEVRMDPSHLHQVIWNLSENAVKYASETAGAIAVELSYGRMPKNGRPFLEISDHGPGIPANLQDSVFEPFATGQYGGTGLGLYICKELCERNGASLRYRSRPGGGSIFQIVFADPARWDNETPTQD